MCAFFNLIKVIKNLSFIILILVLVSGCGGIGEKSHKLAPVGKISGEIFKPQGQFKAINDLYYDRICLGKKIKVASKKQRKNYFPKKNYNYNPTRKFSWPVKGVVIKRFAQNHKGIKIAGLFKTPVLATADGEVVYSGRALKGYGELIILKHKNNFLSAYAHNHKILVPEGTKVKKGQKIAQMGVIFNKPQLHFEIRHNGKPLDPLKYLF